jgi:hypothetical protein
MSGGTMLRPILARGLPFILAIAVWVAGAAHTREIKNPLEQPKAIKRGEFVINAGALIKNLRVAAGRARILAIKCGPASIVLIESFDSSVRHTLIIDWRTSRSMS